MRAILISGSILAVTFGYGIAAASDVDGTYVGAMTLVKNAGGRCPAGREITIVVKDGKVPVSWRKEPGEAVVQPDGSFAATVAGARSAGKISGGSLENDLSDGTCAYRWSLKRQP
jgi:hypothetical protein